MKDESTVLRLDEYRRRKQQQGVESAASILRRAAVFTERNVNIREKVRAKHIFRELLGLPADSLLGGPVEEAFSQWFLFDYKTIQGQTMFSLFIKEHAGELNEPELIQGALFLSTVLELVQVKDISSDNHVVTLASMLSDKPVQLSCAAGDVSKLVKREYVFLRRLPVMTHDIPLGRIYPADLTGRISEMNHDFNALKEKDSGLTLRAFLKMQAYQYLFRGSSVFQPPGGGLHSF